MPDMNGVLSNVYDPTLLALKVSGAGAGGTSSPEIAPSGSQVAASATAAAAAANSATLPAAAGLTNYVTGFTVTSASPAAVVSGLVTLTGVVGGPLNYYFTEAVANGGLLHVEFDVPVAATGPNVAVAINLPAITGGAASAVSIHGVRY